MKGTVHSVNPSQAYAWIRYANSHGEFIFIRAPKTDTPGLFPGDAVSFKITEVKGGRVATEVRRRY